MNETDLNEMLRDALREQGPSLMASIKENRNKLDACPRHLFELGKPPYRMGEKRKCSKCGGKMGLLEIGPYIRGYIAAGGNPDDVSPGYFGK